jgi:hypothetical protein
VSENRYSVALVYRNPVDGRTRLLHMHYRAVSEQEALGKAVQWCKEKEDVADWYLGISSVIKQ